MPQNTLKYMVTNEKTGGQKEAALERFDLLPPGPLSLVARHFGIGADKYADRNWERGYDWSLSFAAMQRHAWAFWSGEDLDPESGSPHLAAVCFHALALMEWATTHPELDDRPATPPPFEYKIPAVGVWPPYSWDTTDPVNREKARAWVKSVVTP